MSSVRRIRRERKLMRRYARGADLIIETGSGDSTITLAKIMRKSIADGVPNCRLFTIDIHPPLVNKRVTDSFVHYMRGWSITFEDFIKPGDSDFYISPYNRSLDHQVAVGHRDKMEGETDLLRKILAKHPDPKFVFLDSGEYCGLPEWRIIKPHMCKNSIIFLHDIYYPKSIKNFLVVRDIVQDEEWEELDRTRSRQGLLIARKIAD